MGIFLATVVCFLLRLPINVMLLRGSPGREDIYHPRRAGPRRLFRPEFSINSRVSGDQRALTPWMRNGFLGGGADESMARIEDDSYLSSGRYHLYLLASLSLDLSRYAQFSVG